jgi:hypothetical protein
MTKYLLYKFTTEETFERKRHPAVQQCRASERSFFRRRRRRRLMLLLLVLVISVAI